MEDVAADEAQAMEDAGGSAGQPGWQEGGWWEGWQEDPDASQVGT